MYHGFFVIRRVGGLEVLLCPHRDCRCVIRRVGGLEDIAVEEQPPPIVIRRVGGLEEAEKYITPVMV